MFNYLGKKDWLRKWYIGTPRVCAFAYWV